jgi:hypothetical protein
LAQAWQVGQTGSVANLLNSAPHASHLPPVMALSDQFRGVLAQRYRVVREGGPAVDAMRDLASVHLD